MATQTSHHQLPYPQSTDPAKPRVDLEALAKAVDARMPKVTSGTGLPPTTGQREGDVHLQYVLP